MHHFVLRRAPQDRSIPFLNASHQGFDQTIFGSLLEAGYFKRLQGQSRRAITF
jgi:hypothetical protein